jgi:hypothetical protein
MLRGLSISIRYISTGACILQFVVLAVSFLWSLFNGAKVEEVIIVEEKRKKVVALAAARAEVQRQALSALDPQNNDAEDREDNTGIELSMMVNPLSERLGSHYSSDRLDSRYSSAGSACSIASDEHEQPRVDHAPSLVFAKTPMSTRMSTRMSARRSPRSSGARVAPREEAAEEKRPASVEAAEATVTAEAARLAVLAGKEEEAEADKRRAAEEAKANEAAESAAKAAADEWEAYAAAEALEAAEAKRAAEAAAKVAAGEWEAYAMAEAAAKAVVEERDAYYREQHLVAQRDGEVLADEWTVHVDEGTGHMYRHNSRTGETAWCDMSAEEHTGWEAGGEAKEVEVRVAEGVGGEEEEAPIPVDDGLLVDDSLATARSRLRRVYRMTNDNENNDPTMSDALSHLISDTRGDWVEVCDADGGVLGAQLRGCTVYYNRETYETRLTKPPGWVRMQAQALSQETMARESRRLANRPSGVAKPAPVHRKSTTVVGRWKSEGAGVTAGGRVSWASPSL